MADSTLIDKTFFLAAEPSGENKWYLKDPSTGEDYSDSAISIEDEIFRFLGDRPTPLHPAKVRIKAAFANRTVKFDISVPGKIRKGFLLVICDGEGHEIEIAERRNSDPQYNLTGIVYEKDGTVVEARLYDGLGNCKDGIAAHALYVIENTTQSN